MPRQGTLDRWKETPVVYRVNDHGSGPDILLQVFIERGWEEYEENVHGGDGWNIWWRTTGFPSNLLRQQRPWQFTNHIPNAASICRKDYLARYLRRMNKVYGSIYNFSPSTYNLPLEYTKLVAEYSRLQRQTNNDSTDPGIWICKPVGLSQGKGILLFQDLSDLYYDCNSVVQRYVSNPLLIGGYKFDLRLYVCVPCFHPLNIYLYQEGLVRFSTSKYSMETLDNMFSHLTNTSLNKLGPGYLQKKDRIGAGCKWTLKQLRHYFTQMGISDWLLWQRISVIITLTLLSEMGTVPRVRNCFELFGFDILVDENLKPWLLEVNLSPALGADCDVDYAVKKPMLNDLLDLLNFPVHMQRMSKEENLRDMRELKLNVSSGNYFSPGNYSTIQYQTSSQYSSSTYQESESSVSVWSRRDQGKSKRNTERSSKFSDGGITRNNDRPVKCFDTGDDNISSRAKRRKERDAGNKNNMSLPNPIHLSSRGMILYEDSNYNDISSRRQSCSSSFYLQDFSTNDTFQMQSSSNKKDQALEELYNQLSSCNVTKLFSEKSKRTFGRNFLKKSRRKLIKSVNYHSEKWGNGRDWRTSPETGGNWVRIFPFNSTTSRCSSQEVPNVKAIVNEIQKYMKSVRNTWKLDHDCSDLQCSVDLKREFDIEADIWVPLK